MKNRKFIKSLIKKTGCVLLLLGVIAFSSLSYGQMDEVSQLSENNHKAELANEDTGQVKNIPFTNYTGDDLPLMGDARVSSIKETVTGLKDAGYSLDEIVGVLKNDDKNAPEISIACLNAGFNGTKIFQALKKSGFSDRSTEAAIPPALRTSSQMFVTLNSNPDSVAAEMAMIEANPFTSRGVKDAGKQGEAAETG